MFNISKIYEHFQIYLENVGFIKKKVKLATLVEVNPKVPFSIATTHEVLGKTLLHSMNGSSFPLILTL